MTLLLERPERAILSDHHHDSEEKYHGDTSQEVSQEVRRQDVGEAWRREEGGCASRSVGQAFHEKTSSREAPRRREEICEESPVARTSNQEARGQERSEERSERRQRQARRFKRTEKRAQALTDRARHARREGSRSTGNDGRD